MPDVLMLTQNDWANTGWRFFKCLQLLGVDVIGLKGTYHTYGYPEQLPIHPVLQCHPPGQTPLFAPALKKIAEKSKVIHFIASTFVDTTVNVDEVKVVMQHGGSLYRENSDNLNDLYNSFIDATIIQCPDLLGLGAKNEHLIYYPVDTDFIQPDFSVNTPLMVGHFPSNPGTKGTPIILRVIEELEQSEYKKRFVYVGTRDKIQNKAFIAKNTIAWTEHLKRIKKCDIIIETCNPEIDGKTFGEWGNSALEASASGCAVITNNLNYKAYAKEYGHHTLLIANNKDELKSRLVELFDSSDTHIKNVKMQSRKWAEERHSIGATAGRLWDKIYSRLL